MKNILKRLVGNRLLGVIDYYRYPKKREGCFGPMNGQKHRQRIVEKFLRQLPLDAIVETGTYCGTTTAYFASFVDIPIYTVEFNERLQGFSFMALRGIKNVHRFSGDSRPFLRTLASDPHLEGKMILFYLDAHWYDDLPLAEELEIIFSHWHRAVVLVDDFEVPDDPGYGYDDYGPGAKSYFNPKNGIFS